MENKNKNLWGKILNIVITVLTAIATKYGVDNRKSASILDTFSCVVQGMIPYGAQMLMAAKLASISPLSIIE